MTKEELKKEAEKYVIKKHLQQEYLGIQQNA